MMQHDGKRVYIVLQELLIRRGNRQHFVWAFCCGSSTTRFVKLLAVHNFVFFVFEDYICFDPYHYFCYCRWNNGGNWNSRRDVRWSLWKQ